MMNGLFWQLTIVGVSVAILFTYIKPELEEVAGTQEQIASYIEEKDKVNDVNRDLSRFLQTIEDIPRADRERLLTYMPDQVDDIAVMRDLTFISEQAGVILIDITAGGEALSGENSGGRRDSSPEETQEGIPTVAYPQIFELNVEGSYAQIKELLRLVEQNVYPLEVHSLEVFNKDGGFLTANITMQTYSHLMDEEITENLYE